MRNGRSARGFGYVGLLIVVALTAAGTAAVLGAGVQQQRRDGEATLLAIGAEFRRALVSYAAATPLGQPDAPRELAELLRDPRYPGVRRHLRRIYVDPLTGRPEWGLLRTPAGRIAGIHSLSRAAPLRQQGFPVGMEAFAAASRYDEWVFAPAAPPLGR